MGGRILGCAGNGRGWFTGSWASLLFGTVLVFLLVQNAFAVDLPEFRICTQNLHDFGGGFRRETPKKLREHATQLVSRMINARCDVIAAQEIHGDSNREAAKHLAALEEVLSAASGRKFVGVLGDVNDGEFRNAFLVASDVIRNAEPSSPRFQNLPKLQPDGPARKFHRPPLILRFAVAKRNGGDGTEGVREFSLINVHQKSKADSWKDPTRTMYETARMEAAEALRVLAAEESARGRVTIVLGDFNSLPDSASVAIIRGAYTLEDFQVRNGCRLSESLEPLCPSNDEASSPTLIGIFAANFPDSFGSYLFKKREELIDEILVATKEQQLFMDTERKPRIGFEGDFSSGSDHRLLWAELNW